MDDAWLLLIVFVLTFAAGVLLILKVPPRLHTPLMSMTNAVSGITVLGALLLFTAETGPLARGLGAIAVVLGAFNLIGGAAVTHRMLGFFRRDTRHE
jgi:H+-translocating NAD(P) transhydrogenase subunit alpha